MSSSLYIEPVSGTRLSWPDIVRRLKKESEFHPYKQNENSQEVFIQLIRSLILDEPVVLPDGDFSSQELGEIGITEGQLNKSISVGSINVPETFGEFLDGLKNLENWSVTLFSSGTTGRPKEVIHDFDSITKGVKRSPKYKDYTWGWAYNATHMAGVQVFFQALLNENTLISLFDKPKKKVWEALGDYEVTHLSATPTFYRLLLPVENSVDTVKNITFGGERIDEHLKAKLREAFPKARFRNIYASTEAGSLFASEGEYFKVPERFKDLIKFEENELWLHISLLGTADDLITSGRWYQTGDLVEFSTENSNLFKFLSRKNEMINVGGYKVNPNEVEEILNAHVGVTRSRVYGKENPVLGNIVLAEVIVNQNDISEKKLREHLEQKLQSFKVPRMIKFVNEIPLTRSGKNIRKS